ncbi:hypothetical protein E1264_27420 [Actinomadura sp. KC216]|uniref:hypothetical protein n=1 Tax=Actinomadura sp. KC216 TaxID=2530370 RepID=UPI001052B835|nr:hypothetical protein [Actinomadura sp. KC216]TDB83681.1 hypothetical protein E1264_27420 [Actinomadura sp. KC216]
MRDELRRRLDAAYKLDPDDNGGVGKETYWRTMQAILGDAEVLGDAELLFEARLAYGWSLRGKTWKKDSREIFTEWLGLLRACLTMWRADPDGLSEGNVTAMWNQFFNIIDAFIRIYPEPADRVHRLIDELERQCLPSRPKVFTVLGRYRMEIEARRGNLAEVERLWQEFHLAETPLGHVLPDGVAEVGATMWERLGRGDRAIESLTPVLTGQIPGREGHVYVDGLLMPYLRAGRTDEAVAAHQSTYTRTGMKLEDLAAHLEFCALTGNVERGMDVMRRNLERLNGTVTTIESMWTAAAVALLCRRVTERGLDEEWAWSCEEDGCTCDAAPIRSYAELGAERRWGALNFALDLDEMDGTTFTSETLMKRMHAEPVVERLDLPAAVGEPAHRRRPRLSPHLAAATTDELRDELARTLELERRWDRVVHLQRLMQNAFATGERDALLDVRFAHLDELLAYKPTAMRPDLFAAFTALVRLHDADPGLLGADRLDRLWTAAPVVLDRVLTRATVHAAQIREPLGMLGRHCRPDAGDLHHLRWYAVELEVRCGDVDAARAAWAAFEALPSREEYATWPNVLRRTGWWLDLGLDAEGLATMGPELSGRDGEERLIVPYLRAGEDAKAREIHERTFARAEDPHQVAAHLEFCVRTGDLTRAKKIVSGTLDLLHVTYDDTEFTFDMLRPCAANVLACRLIADRGLDETWTWPEHSCCPAEDGWSYRKLEDGYRTQLTLFATRWQELTGSGFHVRRMNALADAQV